MEAVKGAVGLGGSGSSGPKLAWLGLGNMGRGMAKNIVEKGQYTAPLLIYNRTQARSDKLVSTLPEGKAKVVTSIEEAVEGADIIIACLSNDAAVEETVDVAIKSGALKGKLFVDCSTIHPDKTNEIAKKIESAGAEFVACPVFGAPAMADSGSLICVLAGPKSSVEKVKPYCKGVMGRAEVDFSDQPAGAATRMKIIGNTFIISMVETLSEGHVLAEKSGLGSDQLHKFIEIMFPGPFTAYSQRMMSGDYYQREEPAFMARLARKDAGHARSLAERAGVKMHILEVGDKHLQDVVDHAGDKGDIAGVYGAMRKESGLKFENQG